MGICHLVKRNLRYASLKSPRMREWGVGGEKSMRAKVERIVAVVSETENVQSRQ